MTADRAADASASRRKCRQRRRRSGHAAADAESLRSSRFRGATPLASGLALSLIMASGSGPALAGFSTGMSVGLGSASLLTAATSGVLLQADNGDDGGTGAGLFGGGNDGDWLMGGASEQPDEATGSDNGGGGMFGDPGRGEEAQNGNARGNGNAAGGGGGGDGDGGGSANDTQMLGSSTGIETEDLFPVAFSSDMKVGDLIEQLHELTGKPITHAPAVDGMSIPIVNGQAMSRDDALNLITIALFEAGVGVVDRGSYIALMQLTQINSGFAPLIGPDQSLRNRRDVGMIAEKVYQVRFGRAQALREALADSLPLNAKYSVDESSNQIVVLYNIGTLKRIEALIEALGVPDASQVMRTFRLQYADAREIAEQIVQLYGAGDEQGGGGGGNLFQPVRRGRGAQQSNDNVAQTADLKVVYNRRHNSVTVLAEPEVIGQVEENIVEEWDIPVSTAGLTSKIYTLLNSDVIKVRDLLQAQFAEDEEATGEVGTQITNARTTRRAGGASRSATDANAENPSLNALAGQFSFIADEDKKFIAPNAHQEGV
ncbi:MAG: secretin N-terminal domain-containing protein, partial [Planctomycetota bacterium]